MIDLFRAYQVYILLGCGFCSLLLAAFSMVINFRSRGKKKALISIELSIAILLFADACAYTFRGNVTELGFIMTRISNFVVFGETLLMIFFLNRYVIELYMGTGEFSKIPVRLLVGNVIPGLGIAFLILSQFTNFYYSFNEQNLYVRGNLFVLSYVFPSISLLLITVFVIQHKKLIDGVIAWSIILYGLIPFVAGITQFFVYGISLINLSSWLSGLIIFFFALVSQNQELTKAANTDRATGLPNPFGFFEKIDRIIEKGDITNYSGFYFDIVHMSQINSKYGKEIGDEIIYKYAEYILNTMDRDEVLGRLGGNYFVALVKRTNTEKFIKLLSDTPVEIELNGHKETVHLSAVAGIYEADKSIKVGEQIVGYCSAAVFYAKNEAHKPYVFWNDDLQKEFARIRALEDTLRKALERGDFEAYYQPKVDSKAGRLNGAEALARWNSDGKIILPQEFIPLMEKKGMVCDLDFLMLHKVCGDIKNWISRGIEPVKVSVNFSRKNLGNPILSEAISRVVEKYDIPGDLIQIEITETVDEYPMSYLVGVVEALHRYGLSAAIDDFGVGSSSISLLARTQFDVLKIDRSFIDYKDEKGRQLLKDIIRMAGNMGISVLAEGVTTKAQVDELKAMGCSDIQGFVYDMPLPKSEFEKRLVNKDYK